MPSVNSAKPWLPFMSINREFIIFTLYMINKTIKDKIKDYFIEII